MKRACSVSLVVAACALGAVAGCGEGGGGHEGGTTKPADPMGEGTPLAGRKGGSTGVVRGVVQIHKTTGGANLLVACVAIDVNHTELWLTNPTIGCPINTQVSDTFKYTYVDQGLVDTAPADQNVTIEELAAYVQTLPPLGPTLTVRTRIDQSIQPLQ